MERRPEKSFEIVSPNIEVVTGIGKLALNWLNTTHRTFQNPAFNHVEVRTSDGLKAFFPDDDFAEMLFREDFPHYYLPYVDRASYKFFMEMERADLDSPTLF